VAIDVLLENVGDAEFEVVRVELEVVSDHRCMERVVFCLEYETYTLDL
jgi:hypothetical protein